MPVLLQSISLYHFYYVYIPNRCPDSVQDRLHPQKRQNCLY